jgi:hypothetical protein
LIVLPEKPVMMPAQKKEKSGFAPSLGKAE